MTSLSFLHLASANKKTSTEKIVENIRKYYPTARYFLASDSADDLSDISEKYKTDYVFYEKKLGYPESTYGYRIDKVLEWLERFHYAAENCGTTHIMMVEDDVWIKKHITVLPEWEMACHKISHGNRFPQPVLDMFETFSGIKPKTDFYGGGGGSIYNVKTFLRNYTKVVDFFKNNLENIQQNYYPTIGWLDCFMVAYYFLCGKQYTENPYLTDTHNHNNGYDYDSFVEQQSEDIEIVNNYKKYYWTKNDEIITFRTI